MITKRFYSVFFFFLLSFSLAAQGIIIYVNSSTTSPIQDGQSWATALKDLNRALEQADAGDNIWVAAGIYYPTAGFDREAAFLLKPGVKLIGSFAGTERTPEERDISANPSHLSGDIGITGNPADNSFTVLYCEAPDSNNCIDGFIIEHGQADNPSDTIWLYSEQNNGGGIYLKNDNPDLLSVIAIKNCKFRNNSALRSGGGIFCRGDFINEVKGAVFPILENCIFEHNTSSAGRGSGMAFRDGAFFFEASVAIRNCIFQNNKGVACHLDIKNGVLDISVKSTVFRDNTIGCFVVDDDLGSSSLWLTDCIFDHNTSLGGALTVYSGAQNNMENGETVIENTLLSGSGVAGNDGDPNTCMICITNTPPLDSRANPCIIDRVKIHDTIGKAISVSGRPALVANSLLYDNRGYKGGGIWASQAELTVVNSTIVNNSATFGGAIFCNSAKALLYNSILWGNTSEYFEQIHGTNPDVFLSNCLLDVDSCTEMLTLLSAWPYYLPFTGCEANLYGLSPQFIDSGSKDFRLNGCSPAINAGNNSHLPSFTGEDYYGAPRIISGIVDIGAQEYQGFQMLVDSTSNPSCFGNTDGKVWLTLNDGCPPFFAHGEDGTRRELHSGNLLFLGSGNHLVSITDSRGNSLPLEVNIPTVPALAVTTKEESALCDKPPRGTIIAHASGGTPPYEYKWDFTVKNDSIVEGIPPGLYALIITDKYGCQIQKEVALLNDCAIYIPNAFSPNGDGINDFLELFPGDQLKTIHSLKIFNRWGQLVYSKQAFYPGPGFSENWSGKIEGKNLESGVYVYVCIFELKDGTTKTLAGDISLLR